MNAAATRQARPWSLRRRLALRITLGVGAVLALLFVLLDVLIDREIYTHFDQNLSLRADVVSMAMTRHGLDIPLPEYQENGHTEFFTLYDSHGAVLRTSPNSRGIALPAGPAAAGLPRFFDARLPDGHAGRVLARTISGPGTARWMLVVGTERERWDVVERSVHSMLAVGIAFALAIVVALSLWQVREAFGFLARAGRVIDGLEAADTAAPDTDMPLELAPFVGVLRAGVGRLREAVQRERRFARDVAHELRTPVSEIRASAEAALVATSEPLARDALHAAIAGSERMQRGIETLLALTRIESGQERPAADPFDLVALLRDAIAALPAAHAGRIDLRLPDAAWAVGDAGMLERMLANLLGNALDYAPAGARIDSHLWRTPEGWRLEIANPAPELDHGDVAHFGQRFWRKHAEGGTAQHAGLGLALCRALSDAAGIPLHFRLEAAVLRAEIGPIPAL